MGKKNKQTKPPLTPEEIEAFKASQRNHALQNVAPSVLSRIGIALTDKMSHCSFIIKDNDIKPEYMDNLMELVLKSNEKYVGLDEMVLLLIIKSPKQKDNMFGVTCSLYFPKSYDDKIACSSISKNLISSVPKSISDEVVTKDFEKGHNERFTVWMEFPDKNIDVMIASFNGTLKTAGIYVEEESDDEDMGNMAEEAGIEW